MIYTIDKIKNIYLNIFEKYHIKDVWIFGSYAKNEATEISDIDFLYKESVEMKDNPFLAVELYGDLVNATAKEISLIELSDLERIGGILKKTVLNQKIKL